MADAHEEYSPDLQEKIGDYLTKMEQIAENRNFLPLRYFQEAESLIRNQTLQSHQQADSLPVLQKALLTWRNELASRNQNAILKWCNELLAEATNSVDKKICREIKSLTIYKQEIMGNVELLRKKTEPYLTCELSQLIQDVILQKIFEHVTQLHNAALSQVQDQLKVLEVENKSLAVECREAKRRTNKEDNQAQRIISEIREKLNLADVKYALLEQTNEQLRQQIQLCQQSKEQALTKLNVELNAQISQLRAKLDQYSEQSRQTAKRSTFLEMELQKQKLLHEQTMLHYQQLISNYHNKEQELKEEILQVSRVSQKEIDHFKSVSTRRIEDWQQTANDLKEQLEQTLKTLKSKELLALSLRQSLVSLKETTRSQIDQLNKKIIHLQYRSKMLQEKEAECEHMKTRFQRIDAQLKRVQRDRDQSNQLCKQLEKKLLIDEQNLQYIKTDIEQERLKVAYLTQQLRLEKQKNQSERMAQNGKASASTQTNEDLQRQKLKAALALIRQMEADYLKLQQSAMRKTYM